MSGFYGHLGRSERMNLFLAVLALSVLPAGWFVIWRYIAPDLPMRLSLSAGLFVVWVLVLFTER